MAQVLNRTLFGDPILRQKARRLSVEEIKSEEIQTLIADMRYTVEAKKYGVGLAAPQVGQSVALSVISIKTTPSRPDLEDIDFVIINPEIIEMYGSRSQQWEGCISFGSGTNFPYARCLRWRKIRLRYLDEHGKRHEKDFEELLAHVLQHETDHLNGVLFVDRVKDSKSFMMVSEFKKHFMPRQPSKHTKKKDLSH
jgi:peptide deformylase